MLWRVIVLFFAISLTTLILTVQFGVEFGRISYWQDHGVFFLVGLFFLPRLTLLLSSVASGGLLWWVAWLFCPRLLIAFLATLAYWYANPVLVICAWLAALGAETTEKYVVVRQQHKRRYRNSIPQGDVIDV